jgi:AraC family transcriptional regulator, melibiose operon regulatory protein
MALLRPFSFEFLGLEIRHGAPSEIGHLHSHTEVELVLVLKGSVTYRLGGVPFKVEPLRLHLFGGTTPHLIEVASPGSQMYQMTLPLGAVLNWRLPETIGAPLMQGAVLCDDDSKNDARRFERWKSDLHSGDVRRERVTLPEVHARLERMALSPALSVNRRGTSRPGTRRDGGALDRVELMMRTIATRSTEGLSLMEITAGTGWHPRYAVTQFRRWVGIAPWEFLVRQRIAHAQHLLSTTGAKVVDVSEECGFATPSAFYVAFERIATCTPSAYRRKYQGE